MVSKTYIQKRIPICFGAYFQFLNILFRYGTKIGEMSKNIEPMATQKKLAKGCDVR